MTTKYYKFITQGYNSTFATFNWTPYLPVKKENGEWTPGEWTPGRLPLLCASGYHVARPEDMVNYVSHFMYEAEISGRTDAASSPRDKKVSAESIRLTKQVEKWGVFAAISLNIAAAKIFVSSTAEEFAVIRLMEEFVEGNIGEDELQAKLDKMSSPHQWYRRYIIAVKETQFPAERFRRIMLEELSRLPLWRPLHKPNLEVVIRVLADI